MRHASLMKTLIGRRDGNVAMTFALMMPLVVGGAGMLVDNGVWQMQRRALQDVADQAALAGAGVLHDGGHATFTARQAAAVAAATEAVFARRPDLTPSIQTGGDLKSVSVSLADKGIVSFAGVFGFDRVDIAVTGQALADRTAAATCLLALSETGAGIAFTGSATYTASGCAVWSNAAGRRSIAVEGPARLDAERVCATGAIVTTGAATIAGLRADRCGALADPLAGWSATPPSGCDKSNLRVNGNGDVTLWPGLYCNGLEVASPGTVTLMPGEYFVRGGPLKIAAGGSVIGDDVGIHLSGNGAAVDIQARERLRLKARTAGDLRGKAIAADRRTAGPFASRLGAGTALDIAGTVYLPGHALTLSGNASQSPPVSQVIADAIELNATTALGFKTEFDASGYPRVVSMVPTVRLSK